MGNNSFGESFGLEPTLPKRALHQSSFKSTPLLDPFIPSIWMRVSRFYIKTLAYNSCSYSSVWDVISVVPGHQQKLPLEPIVVIYVAVTMRTVY